MKTRALARRSKKKFAGGGFNTFINSEQGGNAMGAAAGLVGTAGDMVQADAGARPSVAGGALSMAGKGASMGSFAGPWGTAIGAGVGALYGGVQASKGQEKFDKLKEQGYEQAEYKATINSASILNNYDNIPNKISLIGKL